MVGYIAGQLVQSIAVAVVVIGCVAAPMWVGHQIAGSIGLVIGLAVGLALAITLGLMALTVAKKRVQRWRSGRDDESRAPRGG